MNLQLQKPDIVRNYLRHNEINDYLEYLRCRYSNFVTIVDIGKSFEGRPIKAIKIDLHKNINDDDDDECKKNWIFMESGTHAREWITISVALFCINQLTERNCRNRDILNKAAFFIVPLVNADGYEYSHEKNRSWRKNRRPIPDCKIIGTDCNRNYDFHWNKGNSKRNKSTYHGDAPFSESETRAVRNAMQLLKSNLKFVLSFHSYAQSLMYPWGYTSDLPPNWKDLHKLAVTGRDAIQKATGRKYHCGSISTVRKRTYSGSIADYAFGVENVPFVIVMELPSSKYKFHPPAEQIASIVTESWIGIKAMCKQVLSKCKD